jgi:hypothetical protein
MLDSQVTRNFWPQLQPGEGVSRYVLESFPGLTSFSSGSGIDRGMFVHKGVLYKVTATTLSSINSAGVRTTLGTIPGSSRCIFGGIVDTVIVVADGVAYTWDGATLTTGVDVDFETPNAVAVLNGQAIYDGDGSRFGVSDAGAPLTINGLNYGTAESVADNLLRPYAFNQVVYMMGERHIEGWWNSGSGNPPFDRVEGSIFQIGLAGRYAVANNKAAMYFLASDRDVYRIGAGGLENGFLPRTLAREFTNYSTVSDAVAFCFNLHGQEFFYLKFPSENKSFVYPEGGQWFELSSTDYNDGQIAGRYRGDSYAYCYGKHLIADESGNVLDLDEDTFTDNGDTIRRVRDTAPIHSGMFTEAGRQITLRSVNIVMETGVGGVGDDPQIMIQFSTDGGRTFGTEIRGHLGVQGDFLRSVEFFGLNVTGRTVVIRIVATGEFYYSIHAASAEVEVGI